MALHPNTQDCSLVEHVCCRLLVCMNQFCITNIPEHKLWYIAALLQNKHLQKSHLEAPNAGPLLLKNGEDPALILKHGGDSPQDTSA